MGCEKSTQAIYASDPDLFQSWAKGNLSTSKSPGFSLGKEQVQKPERRNGIPSLGGRVGKEKGG